MDKFFNKNIPNGKATLISRKEREGDKLISLNWQTLLNNNDYSGKLTTWQAASARGEPLRTIVPYYLVCYFHLI